MDLLFGIRDFVLGHPKSLIALAIVALLVLRYGGRAVQWVREDLASLIDDDDAARFEIGLREDDPEIELADEIATDLGKLIEVNNTDMVFTSPEHELTEAYITGRFG